MARSSDRAAATPSAEAATMRVTAGRGHAGRPSRRAWPPAVGFAAAVGGGLLALYLAHPLVGGYRLPIGPDGPVYAWWSNLAASEGLGVVPDRPGVPGLTLVLGAILGTEPLETLALLGPVLAASCGLAGAAVVGALLGPDPRRAALAAVLVGSFAGYLAAGWLANLALATLFLAALASLGISLRSWRAVAAAALLLAAGGLSHVLFVVVSMAILGGMVVAWLPEALQRMRSGVPPTDVLAVRVAMGAAAGLGGAALGFALLGDAAVRVATSQDAVLRRIGLTELLARKLRERLLVDGWRSLLPALPAGWLAWFGLGPTRDRPSGGDGDGRRFLLVLGASWGAVTVLGIAVLGVTGRGPANRLLPFAFFLPLLATLGMHRMLTDPRTGRAARNGAWLAGAAMVAAGLYAWVDRSPFMTPEELSAAEQAAIAVEHLPAGTPLVLVVNTTEEAAVFHVVRFGNVIRVALPPGRIRDLHLAVGTPADYLAGRPTRIGDPEYDRLSETSVLETAALGNRGAVLVVREFNEPGYREALVLGTEVAPGVVSLRGGRPVPAAPEEGPGIGPVSLVLLAPVALALLAALGGGWAAWALPGAHPQAAAAAAPAAGLGVVVLGSFGADGLGMSLTGPAGPVAVSLLGAVGYLAAMWVSHAGRGAGRRVPAA